MISRLLTILSLTVSCCLYAKATSPTTTPVASDNNTTSNNSKNKEHVLNKPQTSFSADNKKLIKDFQVYAAGVPAQARREVQQFRVKSNALSQQKRGLYNILSQESQAYLAQEQKFKRQVSAAASNLSSTIGLPTVAATTSPASTSDIHINPQTQVIIDNFKQYAAGVAKHVQAEIQDYRKQISDINQNKRTLYKALSTDAQAYLSKEREFKKQLAEDLDLETITSEN